MHADWSFPSPHLFNTDMSNILLCVLCKLVGTDAISYILFAAHLFVYDIKLLYYFASVFKHFFHTQMCMFGFYLIGTCFKQMKEIVYKNARWSTPSECANKLCFLYFHNC